MNTVRHRNNADTINPTALVDFSMIIILKVSLFKLSPKTNNQSEKFPTHNKDARAEKKIICTIDEKTYLLRNGETFTLFHFVIFKLFYQSGCTLRGFVV